MRAIISPDRYRYLRQKLGSQIEVAAMLGVKQSVISKRERGLAAISREASLALESLVAQSSPKLGPVRVRIFSAQGRSLEKIASRAADADAIKSGNSDASQVQRKNGLVTISRSQPLQIDTRLVDARSALECARLAAALDRAAAGRVN